MPARRHHSSSSRLSTGKQARNVANSRSTYRGGPTAKAFRGCSGTQRSPPPNSECDGSRAVVTCPMPATASAHPMPLFVAIGGRRVSMRLKAPLSTNTGARPPTELNDSSAAHVFEATYLIPSRPQRCQASGMSDLSSSRETSLEFREHGEFSCARNILNHPCVRALPDMCCKIVARYAYCKVGQVRSMSALSATLGPSLVKLSKKWPNP